MVTSLQQIGGLYHSHFTHQEERGLHQSATQQQRRMGLYQPQNNREEWGCTSHKTAEKKGAAHQQRGRTFQQQRPHLIHLPRKRPHLKYPTHQQIERGRTSAQSSKGAAATPTQQQMPSRPQQEDVPAIDSKGK
jgi:hypothetical protein